jgi:hypothetical protein
LGEVTLNLRSALLLGLSPTPSSRKLLLAFLIVVQMVSLGLTYYQVLPLLDYLSYCIATASPLDYKLHGGRNRTSHFKHTNSCSEIYLLEVLGEAGSSA